MKRDMQRRKFIAAAGAAAAVGLAGCSGDNGADTSSPGAVVESYYDLAEGLDSGSSGDELLDELDPVLHSESPLRAFLEGMNESQGNTTATERSVSNVDTEVAQEDLSAEELSQNYRLGFMQIDQSVIDSLAEENAVVDTTVEYEDAETTETQWLTATEDGDWQIFTGGGSASSGQ